jgi:hypothetical protein
LSASQFAAFADGIGDLAGFSEADSDFAASIPDDDERTEIKPAATFDDLGGAIDKYNFLHQFLLIAKTSLA